MAKLAEEGRWYIDQLLSLETRTLVVATPSDQHAPTMQEMLKDLRENYRSVAQAPPDARFTGIVAALEEHDPRSHRVDRVLHYGFRLHDIVERAGGTVEQVDDRKLTPADANTIRRAWEMALDPIDLKTTVWLDCGDAVSSFACADGEPPASIVRFHGAMAGVALDSWGELIKLVGEFLASVGSILRRWRRTGIPPWRGLARVLRPCVSLSPAPRERVTKRVHSMFGTGGKLFVSGSGGPLRTLVQLDGNIITRATPEIIHDDALWQLHQAKIEAWFARLNRDWRLFGGSLSAVATLAALVLLVEDVVDRPPWHLVLMLVPFALRRGIAITVRRYVLHATKGAKSLLPARG